MPNIGPGELLALALFALLLFGPKKLPEVGRGLGKGLREFKDALSGASEQLSGFTPPTAPTDAPAIAPPVTAERPTDSTRNDPEPR